MARYFNVAQTGGAADVLPANTLVAALYLTSSTRCVTNDGLSFVRQKPQLARDVFILERGLPAGQPAARH